MWAMQNDVHSTPSLAEAEHWQARDLAVLWHPCTQMREHPNTLPLVPIHHGEGAWLIGMDGRRYLDAVSSWWTNIHGHAEPRIAEAIAQQARSLEQVILAGFSHAPAIELAERVGLQGIHVFGIGERDPSLLHDRSQLSKSIGRSVMSLVA